MLKNLRTRLRDRDARWLAIWLSGVGLLAAWNLIFLNRPAFKQVAAGFFHTLLISLLAASAVLLLGWGWTLGLHALEMRRRRRGYLLMTFVQNLFRSVPQIIGVLFGYVLISQWLQTGAIASPLFTYGLMAFCMSLFIFSEMADLMRERIAHFRKLDFYNAMRVCGIPEGRIVNFDILWKNSRIHVLNKLIAVFGAAVFLQCSVDFIISVGLSTNVNAVTLPATLGSLLAKIDSKQDILAIGFTLTHPGYLPKLFLTHLQGVTVAFLIVFTLLCVYNVSNGYAERHRL
jgi:ABC-type dipeptide/oligopeptide/nickel transport system permease subunit